MTDDLTLGQVLYSGVQEVLGKLAEAKRNELRKMPGDADPDAVKVPDSVNDIQGFIIMAKEVEHLSLNQTDRRRKALQTIKAKAKGRFKDVYDAAEKTLDIDALMRIYPKLVEILQQGKLSEEDHSHLKNAQREVSLVIQGKRDHAARTKALQAVRWMGEQKYPDLYGIVDAARPLGA